MGRCSAPHWLRLRAPARKGELQKFESSSTTQIDFQLEIDYHIAIYIIPRHAVQAMQKPESYLIGKKLREIRIAKSLTQLDVSNLTGIHQSNLSSIECGRRRVSMSVVAVIADALGCSTDRLLPR
jgi:DNA-binding XRE family transcriptional regulator